MIQHKRRYNMRKIFLILVSVIFVMTTSTACYAADSDEWKNNTGTINLSSMTVKGSGVSASGSIINITKGGDFEVTGTLADGMIYIKSDEKVKLRLSGASITNSNGPAIYFDNAEKAFITITEGTENYLTDGKTYSYDDADAALFSNDDLEIKGGGTLNITANYRHGIASDDDLSIKNGTINITSYEHSIKANDKLSVFGGDITAVSETGKGMKAGEELVIEAGTLNLTSKQSEGIESKGTLTINGGNINVTAADDGINTGNENSETNGFEPPEWGGPRPDMSGGQMPPMNGQTPERNGEQPPEWDGQRPDMSGRQMPQDGQRPDIGGRQGPDEIRQGGGRGMGGPGFGGDFGHIDEETAAAHAITINGGNIYINADGDGIDSNGNLTINGGTVKVDGPTNGGDGALDSEGTMEINGGTVIAASAMGMNQLPNTADKQNILNINFSGTQSGGTEVSIKETSSGKEILSYAPTKNYQNLIVSSPDIKRGAEYTVYVGGSEYETFTITDSISTVGSAMGMFGGHGFGGIRGDRDKNEITVFVNGNRVNFLASPVTRNDTTLVGFRAILEALGATVTWDDTTQTATAEKDGTAVNMIIGSYTATVNGEPCELPAAPELINNSTMIPVRFISEKLGMTVDWDEQTKQIHIY